MFLLWDTPRCFWPPFVMRTGYTHRCGFWVLVKEARLIGGILHSGRPVSVTNDRTSNSNWLKHERDSNHTPGNSQGRHASGIARFRSLVDLVRNLSSPSCSAFLYVGFILKQYLPAWQSLSVPDFRHFLMQSPNEKELVHNGSKKKSSGERFSLDCGPSGSHWVRPGSQVQQSKLRYNIELC